MTSPKRDAIDLSDSPMLLKIGTLSESVADTHASVMGTSVTQADLTDLIFITQSDDGLTGYFIRSTKIKPENDVLFGFYVGRQTISDIDGDAAIPLIGTDGIFTEAEITDFTIQFFESLTNLRAFSPGVLPTKTINDDESNSTEDNPTVQRVKKILDRLGLKLRWLSMINNDFDLQRGDEGMDPQYDNDFYSDDDLILPPRFFEDGSLKAIEDISCGDLWLLLHEVLHAYFENSDTFDWGAEKQHQYIFEVTTLFVSLCAAADKGTKNMTKQQRRAVLRRWQNALDGLEEDFTEEELKKLKKKLGLVQEKSSIL